jgi:ABC-2 type transport system permease protein
MNTNLNNVIKREFHRIAERKTLYLLMILLPVFLYVLYASIYRQEILRELPVAVLDEDHSELSRRIIELIESSPSMKVVYYVTSQEEMKNGFLNGTIQGAFYFPKDFEYQVKKGKSSTVAVYKNTSNLIIGNTLLKDASTIIKSVSAAALITKLGKSGVPANSGMNIANAVKVDTQILYNPNYSYSNFLVPGLLGVTLQMMIMIASVIVISSEFTHNTFEELLKVSGNNVWNILIGKAFPHFIIHCATALLIVGIIFPLFDIKILGSIPSILFLFALFILANLMLGLMISSFFHDQFFATELAVFFNTPGFIFSGFTFPLWSMPVIHNYISMTMPFTHFLSAFLKVFQMNTQLSNCRNEIFILSGFVIVSSTALFFILKHHQNKIIG